MLNQEEIKSILVLISRANITGQEALPTALLQQKLQSMQEIKPDQENKDIPIDNGKSGKSK